MTFMKVQGVGVVGLFIWTLLYLFIKRNPFVSMRNPYYSIHAQSLNTPFTCIGTVGIYKYICFNIIFCHDSVYLAEAGSLGGRRY